jgi:catechol 2,3-dioxygenase-like lactoylglutathione lyase family enzyme
MRWFTVHLPVLTVATALLLRVATTAEPVTAQAPTASTEALPILGLAGVTFKTGDIAKARAYYQGVLGLAEAFSLKDSTGAVTSVYFKVNDDQFVEVTPNLKPGELRRLARVMVQTSNLEQLHQIYSSRGVAATPIRKGPDGNPVFRVIGPNDANIDFIQYVPGSQEVLSRGKSLSEQRLSTHLWHVGVMTTDRAAGQAFYREKLGLTSPLPGGRNESIDTPATDRNTETKFPPLDPNNPATREQFIRENDGAVNHMALEITDMRLARDAARRRGGYTDLQVRAHVGNNRRWLVHLFDPDGSRTELMETATQESLPAMTVMAPGAVAAPIMPKQPGTIPWPE